jgi:thiol:disulfide interchange protein DsbD
MIQRRRFYGILASLLTLALASAPSGAAEAGINALVSGQTTGKDEFLPPEQAFRVTAEAAGPDQVRVSYVIAPGYYLYRSRLKFQLVDSAASLGAPELPPGENHTDEYFGTQIIYRDIFTATLGVARSGSGEVPVKLSATYQGCADAGLCYPPQTTNFTVTLPGGAGRQSTGYVSEQDQEANIIRSGSWTTMLALFFVSGLGIAFTGCVLPTVPILSGIIVGAGKQVTTLRAFMLSLTYVLGMAFTYTAAGAITAASGLQVQALFQQTWVVIVFAALFVLMALSMFGAYSLQMPAAIQTRLAMISNRQKGGTWGGVAVMGALSALIVTACVAPAMIAALAVISQSGNVARGAAALFAMSLGMGAPLLVVGASAGRLLPRAGAWMDDVKRLAGCMMLGVAAWMLARLISDSQALLLFAIPAAAATAVLWRFATPGRGRWIARTLALVCAVYAATLVAGWKMGANDPLHPLQARSTGAADDSFALVRNLEELDARVAAAATAGQPVMLDFYADWCVSCKEMERYTFADVTVRGLLNRAVLLRADVTANSAADQALLRRFGIFGPPTIAFYDGQGREQAGFRVVGFMKAPAFAAVLQQAFGQAGPAS